MNRRMLITLLVMAAGVAPCSAFAADPAPIRVGGVEVTPAVKVMEKHDDNILSQQNNKKSSWVTVVEPGLDMTAEDGVSKFNVQYHLSNGTFHSSHHDDYLDHFVRGSYSFSPTARLSTKLAVDYSKTHDARGTTFTGSALTFATPDKYHETTVNGEVGYGVNGHIDLTGSYSNKRYDNHHTITKARDLDTSEARVSFSYPIAPATRAVLEARYKRFNYKLLTPTINLDSNEQRYFAGLNWEATALTSGSLRVGYLKKRFSSARQVGTGQFSWELGAKWAPTTYSNIQISSDYGPKETDGTGSYIKSIGADVSWDYAWNQRLSHNVHGSYRENRYQGVGVARKDRLSSAGLSVDYQIQRWLGLGAGYDYLNRNSSLANTSFKDNTWSLNLLLTL